MNIPHLAKPYARALFEVATQQQKPDAIHKDMQLIDEVCRNNKDFVILLKSPIVHLDKKKIILRKIFEKHIDLITLKFLLLIISRRRDYLLPWMALEFIELYKESKGIQTAYLFTAAKPDDDFKQEVTDFLHKKTGKEIELIEEIKEYLIGGFIIRHDDKQYDASIHRKLQDLKQEVARINLFIKGY